MHTHRRGRSDGQRLAFREERGRRRSWLSAALSGRLTGSGAVFSGQQTDPLATISKNIGAQAQADAQAIIDKAKKDLGSAAASVVQNAVSSVSPGAVVVTPTVMLVAIVVVVAVFLYKK